MLREYVCAATILAALWASCALLHPAVRRSLLEGLRCLGRYPDLWRIPMFFGLAYAIFQLAAAALLHWRMQENVFSWLVAANWSAPPDASSLLTASALPAAERTAAVFAIFTATFPLSAIFAILLLLNFRGLLREMARSLSKRLGRVRGAFVLLTLLLTALCAVAKPAVYLFLPEIAERVPVAAALAVNFLSVIFELLLGIFFLTYLMLMAFAWRRGLFFSRTKLFQLAMRRMGCALKWLTVIAALQVTLVSLPLFLGLFLGADSGLYENTAWLSNHVGRPLVTALALLCCPVQTILVFHTDSLRRALREASHLLRRRGLPILLFLGADCVSFLFLESATDYLCERLGEDTAASLASRTAESWIEALLAGWFIASWVCLYKSLTTGRKEIPF
jgi:hypothetical protein